MRFRVYGVAPPVYRRGGIRTLGIRLMRPASYRCFTLLSMMSGEPAGWVFLQIQDGFIRTAIPQHPESEVSGGAAPSDLPSVLSEVTEPPPAKVRRSISESSLRYSSGRVRSLWRFRQNPERKNLRTEATMKSTSSYCIALI